MAQIPTYEAQINPDIQQPISASPEAFGAGVGEANSQLSNTTQGIGGMIAQNAIAMQDKIDTAHTLDVSNQCRMELNNLQDQITKTHQGLNAEGVTKIFNQQAEQIKQKYMNSLPGINQKMQFNQLYDNHVMWNERAVAAHEAQQIQMGSINNLNDSIKLSIDACGKDNSIQNITTQLASIKGQLQGIGVSKLGFNDIDVQAHYQDAATSAINQAVTPMIANKDFAGAKNIINQFQNELGKDVKEGLLKQIDNGEWENNKDIAATTLYKTYGDNIGKAWTHIQSLSDLDSQKQLELFDAYKTQYSIQKDIQSEQYSKMMDTAAQGITKAGNLGSAIAYINQSIPTTDYKSMVVKNDMKRIANDMYGVTETKTDPNAWMACNDLIRSGKINNQWDLWSSIQQKGYSISWGDFRSFVGAIDSQQKSGNPYDKWNLGSNGLKLLSQNGISDGKEVAKYWDYVSAQMGDFQVKNKRPPSDAEKYQILDNALVKSIVNKYEVLGVGPWTIIGGANTAPAYDIPSGAKYNEKINSLIGYNSAGQLVKYAPKGE